MMKLRLPPDHVVPVSPLDPDERLVHASCALWTARVLARYPRLDAPAIGMAAWLLQAEDELLAGIATRAFPGSEAAPFLEIARRHGSSPEEGAAVLAEALQRQSLDRRRRYLETLIERLFVLAATAEELEQAPLSRQLRRTAELFGLDDSELELAFFLSVIRVWKVPDEFFRDTLHVHHLPGRKYLQAVLDLSPGRLSGILNGRLVRLGIVDPGMGWIDLDDDYLPLFTDPGGMVLGDQLHRPLPPADVPLSALDVPETDLAILQRLLTLRSNRPVHVLLYGPPGTGKTTLVRGLVHELGLDGLEVMGRTSERPAHRRAALEACLQMAADRPGRVVVVDEADHLLLTWRARQAHGDGVDKSWLIDVLERPGIRAVWIVNDRDDIEPAVRRRFAFSLELPEPDHRVRRLVLEKILRRHRIKRHFRPADVDGLARDFAVSPAVLESAAATTALAGVRGAACRDMFRRTLEARLRLDGLEPPRPARPAATFLREGVVCSPDLDRVEEMVRTYDASWRALPAGGELPPLNLLFHGAPGTGKSFTARHLARLIDRPVVVKRASELLNAFVGGTEQRIADAFTDARRQEAVLVIDEVDSFLHRRDDAVRTWEVDRVNEFLVQLETGPGILVATTNRFAALDAAARRRFTERVAFQPLTGDRLVQCYRRVLGPLARGRLTAGERRRLTQLSGNMAGLHAVRQRWLLRGMDRVPHGVLIGELEREWGTGGSKHAVGFAM